MAKKKGESRSEGKATTSQAPAPDPLQLWREWIDRTERQWNSTLNELTTSESFNQTQSRFLDGLLAVQSQMNTATERYFALINLPSRTDVLSLGQQLASIEERLVDLEGMVRELSKRQPGAETVEPPPRPQLRRTRKAPRPPVGSEPREPADVDGPKKSRPKTKKEPKKKSKPKSRSKSKASKKRRKGES